MGQRWTAQANYYLSQGSGVSPDDRVGIGIRGSGPTETVVPVSDDGFGSWDKSGSVSLARPSRCSSVWGCLSWCAGQGVAHA